MRSAQPVMLVDDDAIAALAVERAFRDLDLPNPLVHVTDGEKALGHLSNPGNPKPCVILLDLNMPRMNGIEFLKVVKLDPAWRPIQVVVLTTSGDRRDVARSYSLGAAGYVVKPVDYGEFVQAIEVIHRYWSLCALPGA